MLEGAKQCLLDKGYARTTARDIVAASGTNLASIGYHYGSKDALLQRAFLALTEEWGEAVGPAGEGALPSDPYERFEVIWGRFIDSFEMSRKVWTLQLEVVTRLEHDEALRAAIKGPQEEGRLGLAEAFLGMDQEADPERARVAGMLTQALMAGVMIQWMTDPGTAPSARDLAEGLRAIMAPGA
ncbi:TetR family transcriptional regulator [Streptomyces spiroverticillatus]|uniref:TetR family transcriptional regulator n=1 Tax=Streptomyces finlayi TaxID=67296 RepID=A0A918X2P3_9ACTN|nr:TetR family transcriptional regulator [Streptomyces spiroverticillatus]GHD05879.1 TetR family transcriptional regulator [Streptomyces finlayi]